MESPLVAVLTSNGADHRVTSRGFPSIAHLLAPFSSQTLDVRDPTGSICSSKIELDFRDIRKQGHLLSLSVLPHVLQEALCTGNIDESLHNYEECLRKFAEPSEYETLRTFIACIFVVSSGDDNPLGDLSQLIQSQHTQQHATTESKSIGPAHCAIPKWTTPNTLKYYVLLHDAARDDEEKSAQIFNQMCATYGSDSCQLLKIGEGSSDGLPNLWERLDFMDQLLERGLVRALQHAQEGHKNDRKDSAASSVSTIAPSYVMVQPMKLPSSNNGAQSHSSAKLASETDREACRKLVEVFLKNSLIPHAERLMRTLNDQLADRRTIGKSLTSGMKKWFGGGSTQNTISTPTSYSAESGEMKSRRLADIAYIFGLHSFAHSQYRTVKKEFENDQAWQYHAAALEMSAVALRFSAPELTAKQFPMRYLEDAMKHMINGSVRYSSIMRCALNSGRIMSELEQSKDAANLLSQVSSLENDHCVGVAQVHAARYFHAGGMESKSAFYYVLAGNRFMKGGIQAVALECYRVALNHYLGKKWDFMEDHLCSILSSQSADKKLAIDCANHLVRPSSLQSETEQAKFVDNFVHTLTRFGEGTIQNPAELPVPKVHSQETRVICGERPLSTDVVVEEGIEWSEIRRGGFHAVAGSSAMFNERSMQLVSDNETANHGTRETPPGERFRCLITLENPLSVSLHLKEIHLEVVQYNLHDGVPPGTVPFSSFQTVDELSLAGGEVKKVELAVLPSSAVKDFRISGVGMKIFDSKGSEVAGRIGLNIKGKRLNKTPNQMKSETYAEDHRLSAKISNRQWPLLDIKVQKPQTSQFYCSQAVRLKVEVSNIGFETIDSLVLSTDGADIIFVEADHDQQPCPSSLAVNNSLIRVYSLAKNLSTGENQSFTISMRAPLRIENSTSIALLFFYRGVSGACREWRMVVDIPTVSLVEAAAKVIDPLNGMVQLSVRNVIPKVADAEIAELDILMVRAVKQRLNQNQEFEQIPSKLLLQPVQTKAVHLDNGQSASICFTMSDTTLSEKDCFWLGEKIDYPRWPLPTPQTGEESFESERLISVLWRSSIVDQGGFKSFVTGEIFLPCPFLSSTLTIPGSEVEERPEQKPCPIAINCPPMDIFKHDFNSGRLCELPLKFNVANLDPNRTITVTVSFQPKVSESVAAVSQVAPENRQLWWPDRLVTKAKIPAGGKHTFTFSIRITQPSVYELGGNHFRLDGKFVDSDETISLVMPSNLVVVNYS